MGYFKNIDIELHENPDDFVAVRVHAGWAVWSREDDTIITSPGTELGARQAADRLNGKVEH